VRSWQASFVALAAIWGASFMFIKVAVEEIAPLQVAWSRCAIGALVLVAVLAATRDRLPRDRALWGHVSVMGLLWCSIPFALFAYAETEVTSVLAGIWNAATPLTTLVAVLALVPSERPTRERLLGLAVGFLGVLVVLGPWDVEGGTLLGQLALLGATVCYGLAFAYARRYVSGRSESGVSLTTAQLLCATAQLTPFALLAGAPGPLSTDVTLSVLALGALGTGIAFVLNLRVLRAAGPTTASSVTYLVPLFSTAFGIALLSEPLTWHQPAGAVVVLLGVAVSQGRLSRRAAPVPAPS